MRFDVVTIFPKIFDSYFNESLIKRAQKNGLIKIFVHNLRDFSTDRHKKVALRQGFDGELSRTAQGNREPRRTIDDKPYGGGPGMVFGVEPIYRAVQSLLKAKSSLRRQGYRASATKLKARTILFSTRGKKLDAKTAKRLSKYDQLILICGRYEGVDERVAQYIADEEISVGDYVLSGGELPALVLIEAVSRFLPGFLGKRESLEEIKGSYPVYTRPEVFILTPPFLSSLIRANRKIRKHGKVISSMRRRLTVPKALLSGDHKKIEEWRKNQW